MTPSYYYKYTFISPEPLYAKIKEELRTYFDAGALDDLLFPLWTEHCLRKLGKGSYNIVPLILQIEDHFATLPLDFKAVREAWMCTSHEQTYASPSANYNQVVDTSIRVDDIKFECDVCNDCRNPPLVTAVYKTVSHQTVSYRRSHLLRAGNIAIGNCDLFCGNRTSVSTDIFDVQDGEFHTNFANGNVFMMYYSEQRDSNGYQMIPQNIIFETYIEGYIKYKLYEMLSNTATPETFNQMRYKTEKADQEQCMLYVAADIEAKKETVERKMDRIRKNENRHRGYNIR